MQMQGEPIRMEEWGEEKQKIQRQALTLILLLPLVSLCLFIPEEEYKDFPHCLCLSMERSKVVPESALWHL